jgi:hypothetical protein
LAASLVFSLAAIVFFPKLRSANTPPLQVLPAFADEPLPPVHALFGTAHKTVGLDISPAVPPFSPIHRNLVVGQTKLQWSGADRYGHGYVQFCAPGPPLPLWEFAPCSKTNLAELAPEDLATQFISFSNRTNRSAVCPAAFGTNWLRNAIRVSQGQIILARLADDETKVYALEFARQSLTNAIVFYLEVPLSAQLTNRTQRTPR